ncbi:hypothetical protein EXU57_17110 [Segetibacter sp. 3557_3]|uniref:hypothetical protein n=1 Tax=Segetibacter sp. 3557_3 TaxID=2547429 RepID=UPI001058558D|nr:hypothetical protein [Segetibacter sp. 3557_3]TDH23520.1 hypothetical protein EXU57_17110 [Segetibacter sp. 3557_3]
MIDFEKLLGGGDLRSIGASDTVVSLVKNQAHFDALFGFVFSHDRRLVMRAADAVEKVTREHPEYLQTHKTALLQLLHTAKDKELKWHLALLVARLQLSDEELGNAWQLLTGWATNKKESRIVRVNSLQALYNLLSQRQELKQDFVITITQVKQEDVPSIKARLKQFKL